MRRLTGGLYYGWVLVLTLGVTETVSYGVLSYAFTVFVLPMQAELGWPRATISGALSLAFLVSAVAGLPVGRWLDLHGPRWLMTIGSIAATGLVLAWSAVADLFTFYLIWFGIGLTLAAVLYEPAFAVVATWFVHYRGRALTLLTFMAGFASVIFLPLTGWLVATQGWRAALVTLAIVLGVGTIPLHALVLRRRPEDLGLAPDGDRPSASWDQARPRSETSVPTGVALRQPDFWWLTVSFCFNAVGIGALFVHLVPYLIERGYEPGLAAAATGLAGLLALPGRLVFTPLGDRLPRQLLTGFLLALQGVALLALLLIRNDFGVYAYIILFGAGYGAVTPARVAIMAGLYGREHFARITSVLSLFTIVSRAAGPLVAGAAYDRLGNYELVFWVLCAVSLLSGVTVLPIRSRQSVRV